jgi:hypothetical protein
MTALVERQGVRYLFRAESGAIFPGLPDCSRDADLMVGTPKAGRRLGTLDPFLL